MDDKTQHTQDDPCPICGGFDSSTRGNGVRCYGFTSGKFAHCTREQMAGSLNSKNGDTYCHLIVGKCNCGVTHNETPVRGGKFIKGTRKSNLICTWTYIENNRPLYEVCRYEYENGDKTYRMRYKDKKGKYVWQGVFKDRKKIVYRLDQLKASPPEQTVFIVEGEKCVDAMTGINCIATTTPGGANNASQAIDNCIDAFKDRNVVILPDFDESGSGYSDKVKAALWGTVKSIKVIDLPGLGNKEDVFDWLKDHGGTRDKLKDLVEAAPVDTDNGGKSPTNKSGRWSEGECMAHLNKSHAIASIGSSIVILRERNDPYSAGLRVDFLKNQDFNLLYRNCDVFHEYYNEKGERCEKIIPASRFWLEHPERRSYDQVIFRPGEDMGVGSQHYNLWRGFAYEPVAGDWSILKHHIRDNMCMGDLDLYQYILTWMADAVQNLQHRPGVALVFQGKQGTGKGALCSSFGKLFGSHFLHLSQSSHLTGKFNSHMEAKLVIYSDEAFWGGDKAAEGALKALVTERTQNIERKGFDLLTVPNYLRLLISSNTKWIVPTGMDERRFAIIKVGDLAVKDYDFFQRLFAQMDAGGYAAMLYYLLHYKIAMNLRNIPETVASIEQKKQSMTPVQRYWYQILVDGDDVLCGETWGEPIPISNLYIDYLEFKHGVERHPPWKGVFTDHLLELCPSAVKKKAYTDCWKNKEKKISEIEYKQGWCIVFPELQECRADWEKSTGMKGEWRQDSGIPFDSDVDDALKNAEDKHGGLPF